ncbi:MAG: hypothetical protein LN573_03690 [Rickettsia endosymbiont of Oxypoda opaca]|nr:hypothetical protein [Rickettsia endosymbiont of Oxypoda opaca]
MNEQLWAETITALINCGVSQQDQQLILNFRTPQTSERVSKNEIHKLQQLKIIGNGLNAIWIACQSGKNDNERIMVGKTYFNSLDNEGGIAYFFNDRMRSCQDRVYFPVLLRIIKM